MFNPVDIRIFLQRCTLIYLVVSKGIHCTNVFATQFDMIFIQLFSQQNIPHECEQQRCLSAIRLKQFRLMIDMQYIDILNDVWLWILHLDYLRAKTISKDKWKLSTWYCVNKVNRMYMYRSIFETVKQWKLHCHGVSLNSINVYNFSRYKLYICNLCMFAIEYTLQTYII